jgi:hypothetical protein
MVDIPKIKKKINAFLIGEEGKISKEALLKTGMVVTAFAVGSAIAASDAAAAANRHTNNLRTENYGDEAIRGVHGHHASHAQHVSHGSHGNCGCQL